MFKLRKLLSAFGLDPAAAVRLARHEGDVDFGLAERRFPGFLETYQKYQDEDVFGKTDFIATFTGMATSQALLYGFYRVGKKTLAADQALPPNHEPYAALLQDSEFFKTGYHYDLIRVPEYDALCHRTVIEWPAGRLWYRRLTAEADPLVTEILPVGYVGEFPGYLSVLLEYHELKRVIEHPAAHRQWHAMLGGAAGVYLILNTRNGQQYVGSAYGKEGILGRWRVYASIGHGDNKKLKKLLTEDPDAIHHLQFTILETLPLALPQKEVIARESFHKLKLGCRAFGLNEN